MAGPGFLIHRTTDCLLTKLISNLHGQSNENISENISIFEIKHLIGELKAKVGQDININLNRIRIEYYFVNATGATQQRDESASSIDVDALLRLKEVSHLKVFCLATRQALPITYRTPIYMRFNPDQAGVNNIDAKGNKRDLLKK